MAVRDRAQDALWSTAGIMETQRPAEAAGSTHEWRSGRAVVPSGWERDASEWWCQYWEGSEPGLSRLTAAYGFPLAGPGPLFHRETDPSSVAWYRLPTYACGKYPAVTTISATGDLPGALPTWIGPVLERLNSILALPEGWDGYDARQPDAWHAVEAFRFLQGVMRELTALPSIVPLADGGIQVEWHQGGVDVEATFTSGPDRGLYFADLGTGYEFEGPVDIGISELRSLIARLEEENTATTVHAAH